MLMLNHSASLGETVVLSLLDQQQPEHDHGSQQDHQQHRSPARDTVARQPVDPRREQVSADRSKREWRKHRRQQVHQQQQQQAKADPQAGLHALRCEHRHRANQSSN
jgi:hypothetical protein